MKRGKSILPAFILSVEIKNVPLDLTYSPNQTWPGFIPPWLVICPACQGQGMITKEQACLTCNGVGKIVDEKKSQENPDWLPAPPPIGDGYQLWHCVGRCPMSPIFKDLSALAGWCTNNTLLQDHELSTDEWLKVLFLD